MALATRQAELPCGVGYGQNFPFVEIFFNQLTKLLWKVILLHSLYPPPRAVQYRFPLLWLGAAAYHSPAHTLWNIHASAQRIEPSELTSIYGVAGLVPERRSSHAEPSQLSLQACVNADLVASLSKYQNRHLLVEGPASQRQETPLIYMTNSENGKAGNPKTGALQPVYTMRNLEGWEQKRDEKSGRL